MKTKMRKWSSAVFIGLTFMFAACSKDEPSGVGQAEIQVTDAPTDDESVQGVFITITEVRVDGKAISGFEKQTINLKAYQEGSVKSLGTTSLSAGTHSQITFVLDVDHDANGNAPGCYVQTIDNSKYKLGSSGTMQIAINKAWNVAANSSSTIVADFDIRKSIKWSTDATVKYAFVSAANLQASVRVVDKMKAGTLNGTYAEQTSSNADKVIVYAYAKGTFNAATETQAQGEDAIYFKNAVSSAEVKGIGSLYYKLSFLESGDYELHFASYTRDASTGRFTLNGMLTAQTSVNGSASDFISVSARATVSVSSVINL
jgi:hypothetical protein